VALKLVKMEEQVVKNVVESNVIESDKNLCT